MSQEVYFKDIRNVIISNLLNCDYDLKIAVAWFTDEKILSTIKELLLRGVNVSIIVFDDQINNKSLFEDIYQNNASIFLSKRLMHNKFCIIDERTIINGSYNWTNNAKTNDENIQITYNNELFASKFSLEFEKIKLNCNTIDEHFKYSKNNLKNLEVEFENFYGMRNHYSFPYFIDFKHIERNKLNFGFGLKGFVYLILNKEDERRILWYFFLSKSDFLASKILKIKSESFNFPARFDNVLFIEFDINCVHVLNNNKYLIEEYNKELKQKYLYFINKKGETSAEKIKFTGKISDNRFYHYEKIYVNKTIENFYFIDCNLNKFKIDYQIEKIVLCNDLAKIFIVSDKNEKGRRFYGLLDENNNIVLPLNYDDYKFSAAHYKFNRFSKYETFENLFLDFYEYPILKKNFDTISINSDSSHQSVRVRTRFSLETRKTISMSMVNHLDNEINTSDYFFLSDDNYKYKDFYKKIEKFIFKLQILSLRNLQYEDKSLKIREFEELKKYYKDSTEFERTCNLFIYFRNEKERLLELQKKRDKESGCYIATMVYNNYDHPEVILLRNFRDDFLNKYFLGRFFIRKYYKYSPKFVSIAKQNNLLQNISKFLVYWLVKQVKKYF